MIIPKMANKDLANTLKQLCRTVRHDTAVMGKLLPDDRYNTLRSVELQLKCIKILHDLGDDSDSCDNDIHITFDGGCDKWAQ